MAQRVMVLALFVFLFIQANADDEANPPSLNSDEDLAEPPTGNIIGPLEPVAESPDNLHVAPMSGPAPPGTSYSAKVGDASTLQFSAIAKAVILANLFYL